MIDPTIMSDDTLHAMIAAYENAAVQDKGFFDDSARLEMLKKEKLRRKITQKQTKTK